MDKKPLTGYRVVDLSEIIAGPYCTSMLGAMGAEVIKVERYGKGDNYRYTDTLFPEWNSSYFVGVNHSKRGVTLNLKNEAAQEILFKLLENADVFVESMRPQAVRKLGLDYERISAVNPRIVYCSISAFGEQGPLAEMPGMDITVQAISGIMHVTGEPEGGPVKVGSPVCDFLASFSAYGAIMTALLTREQTGRGQKVEINLLDAQIAALSTYAPAYFAFGKEMQRVGSGHPDLVPYQAFPTSDGYVIVGCLNEKFWQNLCTGLGMENLLADERFWINVNRVAHRQELLDILNPVFQGKSTAAWLELLEQHGVPCSPVNTLGQALSNPQLLVNGMINELEHPLAGNIKVLGLPFKLMDTPGSIVSPAPLQGQHTTEVLRELGYDEAAIDRLINDEVVAGTEN